MYHVKGNFMGGAKYECMAVMVKSFNSITLFRNITSI